jgi:hypothetical protein
VVKSKSPSQFPGYDLEQRNADGRLVAAHRLIDGAFSATALFDGAGALVNYGYSGEGDASASRTSLIRVAKDGRLVWQQTGLYASILGLNPASGDLWMWNKISATSEDRALTLVDMEGNVTSIRKVYPGANGVDVSLQSGSEDALFAWINASYSATMEGGTGTVHTLLLRLDREASVQWAVDLARVPTSDGSNLGTYSLLPSVDGHPVMASSNDTNTRLVTISSDGARCATSTVNIGDDVLDSYLMAFSAPSGAYFIATHRGIAKIAFTDLP